MKRAELLASFDVGANIKKLRENKGLSQEQLAKGICDRTNITKLENGHTKIPSLNFVLLLCDRLEVTIEEFLNYSLSNSYSLNRNFILNSLLNNSNEELKEYLSLINYDYLSNKDQKYYIYLKAKLLILDNPIQARTMLYSIIPSNRDIDTYNIVETLAYHELIKNKLIEGNEKLSRELYSNNNINKFIDKNSPLEVLYYINDLLNINISNISISKFLLEKEIQFINLHECYKYLVFYYTNKIFIYKENINVLKDSENKLKAIQNTVKYT